MANVDTGTVAVVGLGYVGLPVAVAFARQRPTVGFDINTRRIEQLRAGLDVTREISREELQGIDLEVSSDPKVLQGAEFVIVGVPTPIDDNRQPNLKPLLSATRTVAENLRPGTTVIYESTVYPGVTEEICAPLLCEVSGLSREQFKVGYSPERINPGDRTRTLENVVKIVSGEDEETLDRVARLYSNIVKAGVFRATSIKVAEAAKVIENVQRDINIALMNELSIIFDRLAIPTDDVLAAAGSKWNFLGFRPGLVGGHCIGVDPYYLTAKAEAAGYHPQMILAGRRINDTMSVFVAQKMVKLLIAGDVPIKNSRVGVLGVTFKENVTDCRNSKVFDVIRELESFGVDVVAHDPLADRSEVQSHYGVTLVELEELRDLDGLILAVPHRNYDSLSAQELKSRYRGPGVFIDLKSSFRDKINGTITYWSL